MEDKENLEMRLDAIISLLQNLLALELSRAGMTQDLIGKRLHVAKATVVEMLKGIKKDK